MDRQTDRYSNCQMYILMKGQTDRHVDKQADRCTYG